MTEPKRLKKPSFEVYYWDADGNASGMDIITAMPFDRWQDLITLQEKLIYYTVYKTTAIGSLLKYPDAMTIIRSMASMLIVVGKDKPGIDLDNLLVAGDYAQIARIFLSEVYDEKEMAPTALTPSAIARIHGFDFGGKLDEFIKQRREKELKKMMAEIPEPEKVAEPVPEMTIQTPVSTSLPAAVAGIST